MPVGVKVVGGLGNATDDCVVSGVIYTSDNGFKRVGSFQETDPTVPAWAKQPDPPEPPKTVVQATLQTFNDEQMAQARENIGAASEVDVNNEFQDVWADIDSKLKKSQGVENVGKFLVVGADGIVSPKEILNDEVRSEISDIAKEEISVALGGSIFFKVIE